MIYMIDKGDNMIKCQNCGVEIPPTWSKVLASNECPSCGEPILNESTVNLIEELTEALTIMPNDPRGLAGWLISNYRMQKVGSAEPVVKFNNGKDKAVIVSGHVNPNSPMAQRGESPMDKFFKNAGVNINASNNDKFKEIVSELRDPEEEAERRLAIELAENPDSIEEDLRDPDFTRAALAAMEAADPKTLKAKMSQLKSQGEDVDFTSDGPLPQSLQTDRIKRLQKQRELNDGGTGIIKRS